MRTPLKGPISASTGVQPTVHKALDALLAGLSTVAKQAASELGFYATEEAIIARATKRRSSKSTCFTRFHRVFGMTMTRFIRFGGHSTRCRRRFEPFEAQHLPIDQLPAAAQSHHQ